jgi:hypothetical protein
MSAEEFDRGREERYRRHCLELQNSWKRPLSGVTGDAFTDAVLSWNAGDIEPIAQYVEDLAERLSPAGMKLRTVASILRILHLKAQKRPRGRPGGTATQWTDPNYRCAQIAEARLAAWRLKEKTNVPDPERKKIIDDTVAEAKGWKGNLGKKKSPSAHRVKEILRQSRKRRLPPLMLIAD